MSYLPRMSKTYKEPQQQDLKEPEESLSLSTLKPASSLLNEKIYNPQTILKHYRYHPHPLPVLPGPSVLEEVIENELFREANRLRRSASKMEDISKASESIAQVGQNEESGLENESSVAEIEDNLKRPQSRKGIKKSKSNLGKRKSAKYLKRENTSKIAVNVCLVKHDKPFLPDGDAKKSKDLITDFELFNQNENMKDMRTFKYEKSVPSISSIAKPPKTRNLMEMLTQQMVENEPKNTMDQTTQCDIVGNFSKSFVIPPAINSLLRSLSFLLHEINKETISSYSKEKKTILAQSQSILDNLCNEKVEKEYSFDMTYSDCKRLEKILGELKKYLRDVYGDKSEYIDKMEDLKKVFIELRKKEMELFDLGEKLEELDDSPQEIILKEKDLKNPEVALQNNRLESEQLMAEVEFSLIELRNYQKALAELDWDIKNSYKQMSNLKKSTSGSKTEVVGRKCSRKFSSEVLPRGSRSAENESSRQKT